MQVNFTFRHTNEDSHDSTREYIKSQVAKHLKPQLERFNSALLRLHATIELHKDHYNVTFRLHLPPKKVLVTHNSDAHLRPAIEAGIEKLIRQVEKHYAHISGREDWSRKTRRKQMKQLEVEANQFAIEPPNTEKKLRKQRKQKEKNPTAPLYLPASISPLLHVF